MVGAIPLYMDDSVGIDDAPAQEDAQACLCRCVPPFVWIAWLRVRNFVFSRAGIDVWLRSGNHVDVDHGRASVRSDPRYQQSCGWFVDPAFYKPIAKIAQTHEFILKMKLPNLGSFIFA